MKETASPQVTRITLQVLSIGLLIGGAFWILEFFLPSILWATIIAVTTWPLLERVQSRLWNKRGLAILVMIGALLVMDGTKLVGIISVRDYARKVILQGRSSHSTQVREIMTSRVVYTEPERNIDECMALMTDKRIRHLPVLQGGEVSGVISIGDLVKAIITEQKFIIEQLERYITS